MKNKHQFLSRLFIVIVFAIIFYSNCQAQNSVNKKDLNADPLPSWNDTKHKKDIITFVENATKSGSKSYIEPSERIATFDNDGTLWSEQPIYFPFYFAFDRVNALASQHPEWKTKEPYATVLSGNTDSILSLGNNALNELFIFTHTGVSTDEYAKTVAEWIVTARHPKTKKLFTEMVFQPMLELLSYLRANGFKTYIVSGGDIDFMRPWAEKTYGIPPEQIIGSCVKKKFELVNDKPVIIGQQEMNFIDDVEGKPLNIQLFIGRRPVLACGNSDGDLPMLQWTAAGSGSSLCLYIHHTDGVREWTYDRKSNIGRLDKGLDQAILKGWLIIDMKNDWKVIYPFQKK